jgi:sortase A
MLVRSIDWMRRLFLVAGFLILGYCGADWLNARLRQAQGNHELDRILGETASGTTTGDKAVAARHKNIAPRLTRDQLLGKVEVPRLGVSAIVFEGTDTGVLDHGVGHVDGTALPGQAGNIVLAAHRDTFFRSLGSIRKGDTIKVTTEAGPRAYYVDSMEVADPSLVSVLDPSTVPTLTLITCYPFDYIGNAPKRFIVRAVDAEPREESSLQTPKPARTAVSEQQMSSRSAPVESASNLTYVFRASQSQF